MIASLSPHVFLLTFIGWFTIAYLSLFVIVFAWSTIGESQRARRRLAVTLAKSIAYLRDI